MKTTNELITYCCLLAAITTSCSHPINKEPIAIPVQDKTNQIIAYATTGHQPNLSNLFITLNSHYHNYLTGDMPTAQSNIVEMLDILEHSDLPSEGKTREQFLAYSRLFVLAAKSHQTSLATNTWQQVQRLSQLISPNTTNLSPAKCIQEIENFDQTHNHGQLPAYLQTPRD